MGCNVQAHVGIYLKYYKFYLFNRHTHIYIYIYTVQLGYNVIKGTE